MLHWKMMISPDVTSGYKIGLKLENVCETNGQMQFQWILLNYLCDKFPHLRNA